MKILKPYVRVENVDGKKIMKTIERAGRTCYKSHITNEESYKTFISNIIKSGHESVIEHEKVTVRLYSDIGCYKDLTRHRLTSFSVESTRYCCYDKEKFGSEISFIEPIFKDNEEIYSLWLDTMSNIEKNYMKMREYEATPDVCRMLLPHSTAAEFVMTANIREWRHIFKLRCNKAAHPSVRQVMIPLLLHFKNIMPELFADISYDEELEKKHYAKIEIVDEI